MGKTLRTIALCSAIAVIGAGSFFIGNRIGEIKNKPRNVSYVSSMIESESKRTRKNLADYLFQGAELRSIEAPSDAPKPIIINREDFDKSSVIYSESGGLLRIEVGEYTIPKIEDDSEKKDLVLKAIEFESAEAMENFVKESEEKNFYQLFTKENIVSLIEPSINLESLSPKQTEVYVQILKNYLKRTGVNPALGSLEQQQLFNSIKEPYLPELEEDNSNSESQVSSNPESGSSFDSPAKESSKTTKKEIIHVTSVGKLEDYLFQGSELKLVKLTEENVSYHNLEESGPIILPYPLFTSDFNSNPVSFKRNELGEGEVRNFFDEFKINEFEWAQYKIPQREYFSRQHPLDLLIFKFKGNEDAKRFLARDETRFPAFIKNNTLSMIYAPTYGFVYNAGLFSTEQWVMYMDLVFDYKERTGMELILSNKEEANDSRLESLNELRDKYSFELRKN
jgi:hypothetical protein